MKSFSEASCQNKIFQMCGTVTTQFLQSHLVVAYVAFYKKKIIHERSIYD